MVVVKARTRAWAVVLMCLAMMFGPLAGVGTNPGQSSYMAVAHADEGDDWHYTGRHEVGCAPVNGDADSAGTSDGAPTDTGGDWLTPGTDKYKVAQEIYDTFTKKFGTSGAFAVGVIASVKEESADFQIDIVEGGAHAGMDKKSGSSAGGGLFQFTPATKYENSDSWHAEDTSNGWAPANQIHYVWKTELQNGSILPYLKSDRYGVGGLPQSMEDLFSTTDPRQAARAFQVGYERPAVYHPVREDYASQANKVFNKSNKKADKSKWHLSGGSDDGSADLDGESSDSGDSGDSGDGSPACETEDDASGGALGEDATGEHGLKLSGTFGQAWKWDQVPSNLKKYAIDPKSVGLQHGDCGNWTKWTNTNDAMLNGQCVALSKAMFHEFWKKGGDSGGDAPANFLCNGNQCADAAKSAIGGNWTRTPHAGAVVSVDMAGSSVGHTYIVSHVFANGDIMAIEQNVASYSGYQVGEQCTWNYRVIPKSGYTSENARFYVPPANKGYKVNKDLKTLG